jgi:mono/diheme cytochrome c family protein
MKKYFFVIVILVSPVLLYNCHSSKKIAATTQPAAAKITYAANIQDLVATNCSPCHIPAKGGSKKALDNYAAASTNIDEMIHRIELNPGDKGFMPFKHAKLSDSTIALFKAWKANGMPEN